MSQIKKWLLVYVVIIAIASMGALFGCNEESNARGQERSEVKASETAPATKEIVAESKVNGVIYETELFSILQPDGWKATESPGGVVLEKGGDSMIVTAGDDPDSTEAFIKELMAKMAEQQNGTPVEEVSMLGGKFFQTRFTSEGIDMTMAYGLTNGLVVNLAMTGKDHPNNVEIKAMLDSIKFK